MNRKNKRFLMKGLFISLISFLIITSFGITSVFAAPPVPIISSIAGDNNIDSSEVTAIHVLGKAMANNIITVVLRDKNNNSVMGNEIVPFNGNYDVVVNGHNLVDGKILVSAIQSNNYSNSPIATSIATKDTFLSRLLIILLLIVAIAIPSLRLLIPRLRS